VNVFYVSIRTTDSFEFNKIRTTGVTGHATNYKSSHGDNSICSTRDEISQPSRPISPRAATAATGWIYVFAQGKSYHSTVLMYSSSI